MGDPTDRRNLDHLVFITGHMVPSSMRLVHLPSDINLHCQARAAIENRKGSHFYSRLERARGIAIERV